MIYPVEYRDVEKGTVRLDIVETSNNERNWYVVDPLGLFYAKGVVFASFKSFAHAVAFCAGLISREYPDAVQITNEEITIKSLLDPDVSVCLTFDYWSPAGSGRIANFDDIPCGADMDFHSGCSYAGIMTFPQDSLDGFMEARAAGLDAHFTVRVGKGV